jgi:hypothetical protein
MIPASFQLGGSKIIVKKVAQITGEGTECDGMAFYCESKIELKEDEKFSEDYKEWVFYHELVHHIFNAMCEDDLRKNEKLVSQFATFLSQAMRTMKWKDTN